jgi:alpha-L-fucosidase
LTGVSDVPKKIYLLKNNQKSSLSYSHADVFTKIGLPDLQPDPYVSVIVVEYDKMPKIIDGMVARNSEGGYSLTHKNIYQPEELLDVQQKDRYGTIPEHLNVKSEKNLSWEIYIDEPGEKWVDISYSIQNIKSNSSIEIKSAGKELIHEVENTGKTVGEANSDWVIDNYKSNRLGKILFPDKGIYNVEIKVLPGKNEEINFQWVWIK